LPLINYDFEIINLRRFNYEESKRLCQNYLIEEFALDKLCEKSKGLPLFLINNLRYYKITGKFRKSKLNLAWKINFACLAYFCLGIRYFARNSKYGDLYSILSSVGYSLIAVNKFKKK